MSSTPVDTNTKLRQKVKELEKQLDQYHDLFRFPLGTTGDFVDVNAPVSRLPVEEPLWRHGGPARSGRDLEEQFRCCGIVGNSRAMHGYSSRE